MDTCRLQRSVFSLVHPYHAYSSPIPSCDYPSSSALCMSSRPCSRFPLMLSWRKQLSGFGGFNFRTIQTGRRRRRRRVQSIRNSVVTGPLQGCNFAAIAIAVAAITVLPICWLYLKKIYVRSKSSPSPAPCSPQETDTFEGMVVPSISTAEFQKLDSADKLVLSQLQFSNLETQVNAVRSDSIPSSNASNLVTAMAISDVLRNDSTAISDALGRTEQKTEMNLTSEYELSGIQGSVVRAKSTYFVEAQDMGAIHQIAIPNKVQELGCEGSIVNANSTYFKEAAQDMGAVHQTVMAAEEQELGLERSVNARSTHFEEEAQDMGSRPQTVTANERQGLALEGSVVNGKSTYMDKEARDTGARPRLVVDNEMQFSGLECSVIKVKSSHFKADTQYMMPGQQTVIVNEMQESGLGDLAVNGKSRCLKKEAQDIGEGPQLVIANELQKSGLEGIVAKAKSTYPTEAAQDKRSGHQPVIANENQGLGCEGSIVNGNGICPEAAAQDIEAGSRLMIANEVMELGLKGSVVNAKRTYWEGGQDSGAGHQTVITNEVPKSSIAGCGVSLVIEEPYLPGNSCSTREEQSMENDFVQFDILSTMDSHITGKSNENFSLSENSESSFSLNEKPCAPGTQSVNGASTRHLKNENLERDFQQRLHFVADEGNLSIAKMDQDLATSKPIGETTLSLVKEETQNARKVGNKVTINGAALMASGKRKRIRHESQGHSADFVKLKDVVPVDATIDASEYMRHYDHWLRTGRLKDCIELLESMNRVGVLDMDKVYHAKFLGICRKTRAVNEAFRFVKLIGNPTLSTFNMLLSVCASAEDVEGAFQVLPLVKMTNLKADCKLYTTLISSCAKGGKVDIMFKVFHEMVNAGIEPSVHTYGALIDGCARAGQVAKAFGVYGIMRSKKVKPDRVIFNALITACGRSGAVDRAFDILSEMRAEPHPVDPDHVTVGALISACKQSGQVDRALEVYKMIQEYGIKGTPEVYTMALSVCSQKGDLDFALGIYEDMKRNGVCPDEVFFSALIDVAGHAGKIDFAFQFLHDAKNQGLTPGSATYSSLMGACCNTRNWQRALEVHEEIKAVRLLPTVSTLNALITSLCDAGKLQKSIEVLGEMKEAGVLPNQITYTILLIACQKEDEAELAFNLFSKATMDGVALNLKMFDCLTGLCLRRFQKASLLEQSIVSFDSGNATIHTQWTSWALLVYRQSVSAGVVPTMQVFSQVLGCLRIPVSGVQRISFNESLGFNPNRAKRLNLYSLIDGFGIYDPRAFSLYEEAASLGVVPCFSYKDTLINVDARDMHMYAIEVYLLSILKGLKHRLASGARLPNITVRLPVERMPVTSVKGQKAVSVAGRNGQVVAALLRRLKLPYQGNEAYGKIRISAKALKHWFRPKFYSLNFLFSGKTLDSSSQLARSIVEQRRIIRTGDFSLNQNTDSLIAHSSADQNMIKLERSSENRR